MKRWIVVLFVCGIWSFPVVAEEEGSWGVVKREVAITTCWIEQSLDTVLKDIGKITGMSIEVDPNLIASYSGSLISLDIRDIPVGQVLDEILIPRGLTHMTKDKEVFVMEFESQEELIKKQDALKEKWDVFKDESQGQSNSKRKAKRDGWGYLGGKVYPLTTPSSFNKNKVEHRWHSTRLKHSCISRSINQEGKSSSSVITEVVFVPVIERLDIHQAVLEGLMEAPK